MVRSPLFLDTEYAAKKIYFFVIIFFTLVCNTVNILLCLPAGKRKPPAGEGFSGAPHEPGKSPKS
jgi:hypothetical protein